MPRHNSHMTKINITNGTTVIRAVLNETVAAKGFLKRLPFKCCGYDSGIDYCCTAASGVFDPLEMQSGWKNGDLSLGGGWFALLYGGEENSSSYRNMMIIGHILEDDLHKIQTLPQRVNFTIVVAE